MKLYVVDYEFHDPFGEIVKDRWFLACKDNEEVINVMEINKMAFEKHGYEMIGYRFQAVTKTSNGFAVKITNPHEDLIPDRQGKELL